MKIKTKLTLGVGLLFIMILLLALVGAIYINALKSDTKNILADNYNTLEYSRNMLLALDEHAVDTFLANLDRQKTNITEPGESDATALLSLHFEQLKKGNADPALDILIRKDISAIMKLNMEAIQRKSNVAKETAHAATWWIAGTGTLCFLIAFTLLVNLPNSISNPIHELTESIRQIATENYSQRVNPEHRGEFGELARSFNSMAEKLEEYNNSNLSKLLFEKKRIETLINNMHDPVIGLDEQLKVLFVNDQALKIIGLKPELIIGKQAQDVAVSNDLIRSLIQHLFVSNNDHKEKKQLSIFADNKESFFEKEIIDITIVPTGETEKKQIGHVIILNNITPYKELDVAKTSFIATISHELKTPIASIKMSLQLLENEKTGLMNEEQKQLIESIAEDSGRLLKITSELLNLSQVETGNIQLSIQKSDPQQIIRYAVNAVKMQAEQKQIGIAVMADEELPQVNADAEKTAWVMINLLTNAIRYSPDQSKILVRAVKQHNRVLFSVKDRGKGIDARYRDKIFDKYFQVPGSNKSGTGLGLAISKEFIEAQGGTIEVISELGEGSEFSFTLKA